MDKSRLSCVSNLIKGETYTVVKEFTDYDRNKHPVGEKFEFELYDYYLFDAGYAICIKKNGEDKIIRLKDDEKHQAHIIKILDEYIKPLKPVKF
jgi:hypothetical protein